MRTLCEALMGDGATGSKAEIKVAWGRDVWLETKIIKINTEDDSITIDYEGKEITLSDIEIMYVIINKKGYDNYKRSLVYITFANIINAAIAAVLAGAVYWALLLLCDYLTF